tara:strand:+ start:48 stop:230 length:183 start_codon:yes stop_codon:yes gene_type:complete
MAKRIKIFFPDGENQIEVSEDQLESYLGKGFKTENKPKKKTLPKMEKTLEEEEETNIIEE